MNINQFSAGAKEQSASGNASGSELNVRNFNTFAGNGIDDLSAIQTAIDRASGEEATTIYFPAGTYSISKSLFLRDNTSIIGDGQNSTILFDNTTSRRNDIIIANDTIGIKIMNLTIMGRGIQNSGDCIHFENVADYVISNTKLYGCGSGSNGAAVYASNTSNGKVTHNIILSSRNGYLTPQDGGSKKSFIGYNTIVGSRDDGIHPQTGSDSTIVGNLLRDSGDDNIDLWEENNVSIENNTIVMHTTNSKKVNGVPKIIDGIEVGDGSANVTIKGNQITGPDGRGIIVTGLEREGGTNTNITLINNDLRDLHHGCMLVQDAGGQNYNGVFIHDNRFNMC